MVKAVIFGGTTEGRELCEFCSKIKLPIAYCVATQDGALPVADLPDIEVHVGRQQITDMTLLLQQLEPELVIDATHPYAQEVSQNIKKACQNTNQSLLRVIREMDKEEGCIYFKDMENLITWLEKESGNIFVTMGSSSAAKLKKLTNYQKRIWLRILPSLESLSICLNLGYNPKQLICMQGPFSEDLNRLMFQTADAKILVTKNSGVTGGFLEKVQAARKEKMKIAVLSRPKESAGITLEEAQNRIMELKR